MTRTTCFMVLPGAVLNQHFIEICRRRQCGTCGAVAYIDRTGLLRVTSMLLVCLDRYAVRPLRDRPAVAVKTIPFQLVFSGGARGSRHGSKLIRVSLEETPGRREIRVVL